LTQAGTPFARHSDCSIGGHVSRNASNTFTIIRKKQHFRSNPLLSIGPLLSILCRFRLSWRTSSAIFFVIVVEFFIRERSISSLSLSLTSSTFSTRHCFSFVVVQLKISVDIPQSYYDQIFVRDKFTVSFFYRNASPPLSNKR
jgi:hypothetical protein